MTNKTEGELIKASTDVAVITGPNADLFAGLSIGGGLELAEVKTVTRPLLQQEDNRPIAVTIVAAIVQGKELQSLGEDGKPAERARKPAKTMNVINLTTGEEMVMIANAALESGLDQNYPDQSYVGRSFAIVSRLQPHKGARKLREYVIKELVLREKQTDAA